jgi:hypothetical protein
MDVNPASAGPGFSVDDRRETKRIRFIAEGHDRSRVASDSLEIALDAA